MTLVGNNISLIDVMEWNTTISSDNGTSLFVVKKIRYRAFKVVRRYGANAISVSPNIL